MANAIAAVTLTAALLFAAGCGKSTFLTCLNRMIDLVPG